ncbi:MAG: deoxyribodipyrimidine photo-lyase [Methanomicrobiales archaeon]
MHTQRVHTIADGIGEARSGPVLYWMSRDQRVADNWALLHAQDLARRSGAGCAVVFCLAPEFPGAGRRQYDFMLGGLPGVEETLRGLNIPFVLLTGQPEKALQEFAEDVGASAVVTDFSPLRAHRQWQDALGERLPIPLHEVDAHNIVPCRAASDRQEYAAYTIRPKIHRQIPAFLGDFPGVRRQDDPPLDMDRTDWEEIRRRVEIPANPAPVDWIVPGEDAAEEALFRFMDTGLSTYADRAGDPAVSGQSDLSPYLHFGQLSAQRVALEVNRSTVDDRQKEAFLEQLVVRRELAENFCLYNPRYDSVDGFPRWSHETLDEHRDDPREYIYTLRELEGADTHDEAWNAAQTELLKRGKMHGYMRMYWAKKILEWTESPEQAMEYATSLNDRYELDGRDPNGYTGIAWSIGGVHDRAWKERPVYGKIRYMNDRGLRRKFDIDRYIERVLEMEGRGIPVHARSGTRRR